MSFMLLGAGTFVYFFKYFWALFSEAIQLLGIGLILSSLALQFC